MSDYIGSENYKRAPFPLKKIGYQALYLAMFVVPLLGIYGCQWESTVEDSPILMTVGQRELRQDEFERAYRVFRTADEVETTDDASAEKVAKIRFIYQMADQLVLLEHADQIGVRISSEALNQAVESIKSDYPEGMFEQMMLENAINFEDWQESLRVRLTIEQLVRQELELKVEITEEDIAKFYQTHAADRVIPPKSPEKGETDQLDELLVQQLRRQKTEAAYPPWIEELRVKYPVRIDQAVAQKILADGGDAVGNDDRENLR